MDFLQQNRTPLILLAVMIVGIYLLMRRSFGYFSPRKRDNRPLVQVQRPKASSRASLADAPDQIVRWQVEMHDLARDLMGQLDSKMAALRQLILMADEATRRLEAARAELERREANLSAQTSAQNQSEPRGEKEP